MGGNGGEEGKKREEMVGRKGKNGMKWGVGRERMGGNGGEEGKEWEEIVERKGKNGEP